MTQGCKDSSLPEETSALPRENLGTLIIGAGPAGLTAAYLLAQSGASVTVLEADATALGGISRTVFYRGYRFDIGGHRFFSKAPEIEALWTEMLPEGMLHRPRRSRIYYRGKFFSYPLRPWETLRKLGIFESTLCVLSYVKAQCFPERDVRSFRAWVCNRFGYRLFRTFFKTYTEKVWGMDCEAISADWASQRIQGLSLATAIFEALRLPFRRSARTGPRRLKTLIDAFRYPRLGPGMLWEACAAKTQAMGGILERGCRVDQAIYDGAKAAWTVRASDAGGVTRLWTAKHLISSAPLSELVAGLLPPVSPETREAAAALRYRDFIVVILILKDRHRLKDNWIYIHDPEVKVGRIQNFKAWSPAMVPDPEMCAYGFEYFCFEGDALWTATDEALLARAKDEFAKIGLGTSAEVLDGCVVRQPKAYPVYDDTYQANVAQIRKELSLRFPALHLVGRNGMHKYNNQDHAMMTALLTVKNIIEGTHYDVWRVNEDAEYLESGTPSEVSQGGRLVPQRWRLATTESVESAT